MKMNYNQKVKLEKFIEKIFWALLLSVCKLGLDEVKTMSTNISDLNQKMAIIMTKISDQEDTLKDHTHRLRDLEIKKY